MCTLPTLPGVCEPRPYLDDENDSHKIRQNINGLLAKITRGCYTRLVIR